MQHHDLCLIRCRQERPCPIEAILALRPAPHSQNRLSALLIPAHATLLQALRDQRLAGGLDDARADGEPFGNELVIAHAAAVVAEVGQYLLDLRVARVPLVQVVQRADDLLRAVGHFLQHEAQGLEVLAGRDAALAVDAPEGVVQVLGCVEEVQDLNALGQLLRQERPVVFGAIGQFDQHQIPAAPRVPPSRRRTTCA